MDIKNKIIVVTGAGSGIGKALAICFAKQGAKRVICSDIDAIKSKETADLIDGVSIEADVSKEADLINLIAQSEAEIGSIDLFCSNAGILHQAGLGASDQDWQRAWETNVMSHIWVARHLVPRMIARGGGYLLQTASAAGLLNQIGSAPYGVSKHAAVGFGEWLALTYAHQGIKVSMLCPQAVRTAMTASDDSAGAGQAATRAAAGDGMMEPEQLADIVIDGLEKESFLILPHPEVETYMQRKTGDYDRWIKGMNRLHLAMSGEQGDGAES